LNLVSLQKQPFCLLVAFGITKAVSNYFAGKLANRYGRKICCYLDGFSLAYPIYSIHAASWNWVIFANILLGISQGLTWSST
jgi:MFS family permease